MTNIPTGYEIRAKGRGGYELLIDGQPFPWTIAADGPRVEGARHGFHVLWVPILVDAPMGDGEPDGEPITEPRPGTLCVEEVLLTAGRPMTTSEITAALFDGAVGRTEKAATRRRLRKASDTVRRIKGSGTIEDR